MWNKSGRYRCHGCGAGGDKIDFLSSFHPDWTLEDVLSFGKVSMRHSDYPGIPTEHPEFNFGALC